MDLFRNLIRKDDCVFLFSMDADIDSVIITLPYGYQTDRENTYRGYAHLLEHMTICSNNNYLNSLEKRGVVFNAETQGHQTRYIFLDLNRSCVIDDLNNGILSGIFSSKFSKEQLDIEKKTIIEEHALLRNTMDTHVVNQMIGTIEAIKKFDLDKLLAIRVIRYFKPTYIVLGSRCSSIENFNYASSSFTNIDLEWYKSILFLEINKKKEAFIIELNKDIYSELLAYCIKVLVNPLTDVNISIRIDRGLKYLKIMLLGDLELIKRAVKNSNYKEHAYYRFYMNLSNFYFLYEELIYITTYLSPYTNITHINFEKIFLSTPWEAELYAKYFNIQN